MIMEDRKKYPLSPSEYILLEEVGQGVSAFVYRARCIPLNTIVAIKVLDLERINSNLDDIRREAQTMSLINHPNVLSAYCSFVVEQALWVVMPYMAGGSCLHIMKYAYPDGFEEAIIGSVLKETLKALEYLHSHGHIHRDVKAGNILVDVNGAVKLGDFGVSACMFDTGDRQRSRNTFVGTPCWMAPEVMEQVHGYDFKADIWSFGITALELSHGHAPFSKYPPMKVLLMTLQNSPPGLDYEKDKRFSKAFKEMIAMCLVKDPTKRPTAEKLLRHFFFKRVKSTDPIRNVLNGLSPLGQRLSELKMKDADMLAQKKMPYAEKEEMSQNEYKRGVSGWNFDVEDLKAQAALIPDDDDSLTGREENEQHSLTYSSDHSTQPSSQASITDFTYLVTLSSFRAESAGDAGEQITRVRSIPLPAPIQLNSVDVIKDGDEHSVKAVENESEAAELAICEEDLEGRKDEQLLRNLEEKECERENLLAGVDHSSSGLLVPENVLCISEDIFRTRSFLKERTHSLPQSPHALSREHRSMNGTMGLFKPLAGMEGLDKGQYFQRKGRFSVTSEDVDLIEASTTPTSMRKSASMQVFTEPSPLQTPLPALRTTTSYSAAAILPYLQNILQQNLSQQDSISALMSQLNEGSNNNSLSPRASKGLSRNSSFGLCRLQVDSTSDREHQLLQQLAELQNRFSCLVDELQTLKSRNITLESQLSVIRNKEEEEKIEVEATSMEI